MINLNEALQKQLNLNCKISEMTIRRFGTLFAIGDKVIQIENNYEKEVYNGDIGIIEP